ncbi:MAG: glycosyltransferase family 9 protein [Armatimonas sp.]
MKRILIIRLGAIGDVLMTTPTVRALKAKYPEAEITYITGKGLGTVLKGLPALSEVMEFDKTAKGFLALAPELRKRSFNLTVNLQPSIKTGLLRMAAGAKHTLTYKRDHAFHAVENTLKTLEPLGIDPAACSRYTEFAIPDEAHQKVDALLAERGITDNSPLVLVTPGATAPSRQWPVENLVAFLDLLTENRPTWHVGFFGGGGDKAIAEAALAQVRHPERLLNFIGATNLKESGALLVRANALVTMDTGPMHLAAAVGCPLVALFGATSTKRTGPAPPPPTARVMRTPLTLVHTEGLDCVPCMERTCKRGDLACLTRLSPQAVLSALEKQLL